jgi:hypothetical protein
LRLSVAVAFVFVANTIATAGENLLNYVPEKSQVLVFAKLRDFLQLSLISELKEKNAKFKESLDQLEKGFKDKNITLEQLVGSIAVFSMEGDNVGVVFTTKISEAKLKELLSDKSVSKEGIKFTETKMNGKNVIVIETPVKSSDIPTNVDLDKQSVITYLKKDLVLLTEKDCFGKVIEAITKSNITKNKKMMAWKKDIPANALLWAMFDLPEKQDQKTPPNPMMGPGPDSIEGGMLALAFTGKDKKDIMLDIVLDCKDEQTSGMMAMQAQGAIGLIAMQSNAQNPELAMELSKAISIKNNGKKLNAKISLPKSLQDKLEKLSKQSKAAAPPQALPPGMGGGNKPKLPVFTPPASTKK